ncbi:hypothetical protein PSDVSF_07900 [Pseudodesulfovibrio sediminis]|uniref:Uncharacterized protein n=1 Tax=Pseudodesulfovibrio sediminis TaxID=2810563 RepID=A0ABN6EN28_9BACT|nr:hypothetical protein PSDVSF_07900 [Pseudodesulfovibrio sediminis]
MNYFVQAVSIIKTGNSILKKEFVRTVFVIVLGKVLWFSKYA